MDSIKCQAVLRAAETGSFTAAAQELGYSQSGITRMVSSLEDELGFQLFSRQKKGVSLTENGHQVLPSLRALVQASQQAQELGAEICGLARGSLTIACYFSVSASWMPAILKAFSERYPDISVTMREGGNKEIAHWLSEGSVDLCFCAKPDAQVVCDWQGLYEDPLVAWLPQDHPKAAAESYAIADLAEEAFIHTLPHQDTDQDRLIAKEGLQLTTRFTTKDGFTTYQMVAAGLGVSFNQQMIAQHWTGPVSQVPLSPRRTVSLGLALPKNSPLSPAGQRFVACVQDCLPDLIAQAQA